MICRLVILTLLAGVVTAVKAMRIAEDEYRALRRHIRRDL